MIIILIIIIIIIQIIVIHNNAEYILSLSTYLYKTIVFFTRTEPKTKRYELNRGICEPIHL